MGWQESPRALPAGADAAALLRYASDVRLRARRRTGAPAFALLALGAIMAVGGPLVDRWPHSLAVTVAWCGAFAIAGPVLRRHRRRVAQRRGIEESRRVRAAGIATGIACAAAATVLGPLGLVAGVTAGTAVLSWLGGLPALAAAVLVDGVIAIGPLAHRLSSWLAMAAFGLGLLVLGLAVLAVERRWR